MTCRPAAQQDVTQDILTALMDSVQAVVIPRLSKDYLVNTDEWCVV